MKSSPSPLSPILIAAITLAAWISSSAFAANSTTANYKENSKLKYSARFELQGKPMKFEMSETMTGPVAKVMSGSQVFAICDVKSIERDESAKPVAITLDCKNPQFQALASAVTVFWPALNPESIPVIRFGTWVSGYQQAHLKVEVNEFDKPLLSQAKPSQEFASFRKVIKPRLLVKVAKGSVFK